MAGPKGEESTYFVTIETVCKRPAPSCSSDTTIRDVARIMRDDDLTGIIIIDGGEPLGSFSVEELRDLAASGEVNLATTPVAEVMNRKPVTIRKDGFVFEAIYRMTRHNTRHLAVVDDADQLFGVVSDSDLVQLQTKTPLYLTREIEGANTILDLGDINQRMLEIVDYTTRAGAETKTLTQLISHLNDSFTRRVITLLEEQEGLKLPSGAAYLALGSEGRNEQTLRTDQDSAIIYADDLGKEDLARLENFSSRMVEALETVGVPRCPGDTMVSNPDWRKSLSGWKGYIDQWISTPKPEHMVDFGMFQDFRTLHGDPSLEERLRKHLHTSVKRHALFLPHMARHIMRFPPPLGLFSRFRPERSGKHRGAINLKKAGIFTITEGVSLLGLEAGFSGGSTWDKLDRLRDTGILTKTSYAFLYRAFTHLSQLRLEKQLLDLKGGKPPGNHVAPMLLSRRDQDRLREGLLGAKHMLRLIRDRYRLDLISR